ncbi:response regulator transcription factor [Euzebya tangerina]|uniref:response regulator transcription factor n=1 Tax=Euzebya tangerina TaxID=591198 RepID=UPI000E319DF5|nr:response regulator transcription factor [Euzebya tangerina]
MTQQRRILIVEDADSLRTAVAKTLSLEGYTCLEAPDGLTAIAMVETDQPDLIVMDVGLPGTDGMAVTRRLRRDGRALPILMLTARDHVSDKVAGLEAGADDYLVKPFALDELVARVRALGRRAGWVETRDSRLRVGSVVLDRAAVQVTRAGQEVVLTRTEFDLLAMLMEHSNTVLSREQLLERVWGLPPGQESNTADVHVGQLRRKLEAGGQSRMIQTVRGFGYVLRTDQTA